ncbi:Predicted arabinose efflux permease, MFS family [Gracilibacillus orientalis]|uniref:Predicted arabinose efflux permease, MFS family n=1 Tax=Gracilibacillus orientalis TaxID=334253 RepID=A0A1I4JSV6_9BACI|nr:MFS transporter [Gracilibacillus orientalis]SFL69620.1 Predicted arabinose efflux permease, MFS family [Gracilibacillus orientalis]
MNAKKLIVVGLPMIAVTYGLSRFSYGLMLPYINETINMNQSTSGVISSLSYIAYCIAIVLAMAFSNKVTPRSIIVVAGLSSIIGLGIISISSNPVVLGLGIFMAGMSTGFSSPPYANIVSANIETRLQNQTNSWINSGTSIGTACTGAIAIIMTDSWRETYLIFMVIAIFVFIANYKLLPGHQVPEKKVTVGYSKKEWRRSIQLILASLFIGISCSAYWTFSRDFLLNIESIPTYLGECFWVIIGVAGLLGGTAGAFIDKFGVMSAYRVSVLILSTSSLILGIYPGNKITGFLSPILFGSSYIFITGVLIVWGISVFKTNPSFGLGVPFLILALGQAIGSVFSGVIADISGYYVLFIGSSMIGYVTLVFKPKIN